jgi:uroporphyrinogen decarboxylase
LQETQLEGLRRKAERLYHETEYLLIGNLYVGMYEFAWTLRGFEQFHLDLALNPKMAECLLAGLVAVQCRRLGQYLDAVGDYVPVIPISDDLGQQEGPLISPETYRKFIKPYQRQICEFIKERHRYLLLHCCGAVSEFIPDFIEMGVDALNPIQVSAKGMDTRKLKQEFGRDITLWGGGCDTQRVLPFGTPALVRDEVKKRLEDLASGGGFVFCQVHNIQANVPPENILAMYQAVREYGEYAQVRKEVSA